MKIAILTLLISAATFADIREIDGRNCNVNTYFTQTVSSGQCPFFDQVMVGVQSVTPLRIRCARLIVNCNEPVDGESSEAISPNSSSMRE